MQDTTSGAHALTIIDTAIRQDEHGRYSLNDLHRAAMVAAGRSGNPNDDHQRPGNFLQSAGVQAFLSALDTDFSMQSVVSRKGGERRQQGTFAVLAVALRYAEWVGTPAGIEFIRAMGGRQYVAQAKRQEFSFGEDVVRRLFDGYEIIEQFPVFGGKYRIDWYIPELRLAVEFDEAHHTTPANAAADAARQAEIESALNCRFLRYKAD